MASGWLEKTLARGMARIGLADGEAVVASAHFHSMAFWSSVGPCLALLLQNKWWTLLAVPWGATIWMAEGGPSGRWIDVWTRLAGCLVGIGFACWVWWY